jgi:hypothetical protein
MNYINNKNKNDLALELYEVRQEKIDDRKKIYKEYYLRCLEKIKNYNKQYNVTQCYFDLPIVIISNPNYKLLECIIYILYRLKKSGLHAMYIYPNKIYISWDIKLDKKDVKKIKYKRMEEKRIEMNTCGSNIMKSIEWDNNNDENDENDENDLDYELPPTNSSDPFSILHFKAELLKKNKPPKKKAPPKKKK